ncbi:hypothetical protein GQX73_g7471 [Xylaria multiplex]|uniref:Methyltransferase n=1 Tax=Xylaria multiplex TaxID=323545 RepID=A0A7C8IKQ1_9PEZI|nr:hypothetical protein GQX73_g7471 [Xylaria multiplex]
MAETAFVRFLQWSSLYEKERPFQIFTDLLPESQDQRKTNLVWDERQIGVQDFRAYADRFQLDTHGFTTRNLPGFNGLLDRDTIVKRRPEAADQIINFSDQTQPLLPSNYAHIDAGPVSIVQRIENSFPSSATNILRQRIRAINVWKPLCNPVEEWPLAVCDGATVKPEDLVETDSVRQGSVSTNYYARYAPEQMWYYLKHQTPEEALIFKHFDSEPDITAPYALHASIRQDVPMDAKPRHSIEVRTLVFSETFESEEGA